jgi:hypothetical protein
MRSLKSRISVIVVTLLVLAAALAIQADGQWPL